MLLKTLRMTNFRQYKGETKVSFACDKEKNVTIILGDNTFGKTTLLQAFNWCFYGSVLLPNANDLLNYDIVASMPDGTSADVEVEITLIHDGTEYILTRTQKFDKSGGVARGLRAFMKISYREKDGQVQPIKDSENVLKSVVDNILPQDLSTYFFFDTERVGNISTRKDLTESVKGLLGLTVLDNAMRHLGGRQVKRSVIGQFYDAIDTEGDKKAKELLERIQDAQSRREVIMQQLEQVDSEIKHYDNRKEQLEVILRDNQTTAALQKKKEELERRILHEEKAQANQTKSYIDDFNSGSLGFYAQPLIKQALDLISELDLDDKGIVDLTRITLLDIIKRGTCVCGTDLSEGSTALEKLKEELTFVPPEKIGNTVGNFKNSLNAYSRNAEKTFSGIKSRFEDIFRSRLRIQEWNDELVESSEKIQGKEKMAKYEQELLDVKARLRDFHAKRDRLIREDESKKSDIERFQKLYDGLIDVSGKNRTTMTYIRYAEEILNWLTETYREKETFIREELEGQVNMIFERMYHGRRRVSLDSKYQVTLLATVADQEIASGESEGLNRVKNFAFIAGLVALAKNRIVTQSGENEIDLSSEPYPLVMDAPFSNADETHTSNISRVLPEIAEQVIMFVMQKDWRYAEQVMRDKVGALYSLNKLSEQHTVLKGEPSYV
jgi:DNA sulfur modification protein DndD